MKVEIKRIEVTPTLAAEYLQKNFADNRNLRNSTIDRYASDMKNGRWTETGETIKFDQYGNLIDGQHRLHAVIKSGQTITFFVASGLEDAAAVNIDIGAKRSFADALKITGHDGFLILKGTLAKRILLYEAGRNALTSKTDAKTYSGRTTAGQKKQVTTAEIVDYVQKNDLTHFCEFGRNMYDKQISNILSPSDWVFLTWMLTKINAVHSEVFLQKLATMDGIAGNSPIRTLFKRLQEPKSGTQRIEEIKAAFDAYILGKQSYRVNPATKAARI